jgi:hypothetical protein
MLGSPASPGVLEAGDHISGNSFFEREGCSRIEGNKLAKELKERFELVRAPGEPHAVVESKLIRNTKTPSSGMVTLPDWMPPKTT